MLGKDKFEKSSIYGVLGGEKPQFIGSVSKGRELLTAERRVDKALMKIKSDRSFTQEQNKWLELIIRHLVQNLLMEKEDIDLSIFTREGASWNRLNKIFDDKLDETIHEVNEAIAA